MPLRLRSEAGLRPSQGQGSASRLCEAKDWRAQTNGNEKKRSSRRVSAMFKLYVTEPPAQNEAAYRAPLARPRRRTLNRPLHIRRDDQQARRAGVAAFAAIAIAFVGAGIWADSDLAGHATQVSASIETTQPASSQLDN